MFQDAWVSLLRTVLDFQFDAFNPEYTEYEELNLSLAQEYVRRAALWAQALGCRDQWPFFDAIRRLDPTFELTAMAENALDNRLQEKIGSWHMRLLVKAAIRWYAFKSSTHVYLPDLPDLYAPIIAMYFHHGAITAEHHLIQTPIIGFQKLPFETYLLHAPYMDAKEVSALMTPAPVTTFTFTKGWFRSQKRPLALWDLETAQAAHNAGNPYTVLAGKNVERPVAFLEIGPQNGFIGVTFLDSFLRCYLEYSFQQKGERYFLYSVNLRIYDGDSETVTQMDTYRFTPEGELTIYENNVLDQIMTTRTAAHPVDVSRNWEDVPVFGQYTGFVRVER
ncbi:MAG: hypothetical protein MUF87_11775 [Anaerolineae bacterium]|nr:hypothetical protein [Anaerolineae bacterium]